MEIKFWGTRGSITSPSKKILKYGGNTVCIEIKEGESEIVLDAGYGLVDLGKDIVNNRPLKIKNEIHIFLSHMHWDHIQGIPFFVPIYYDKYTIIFYGNGTYNKSLKTIIEQQFSLNYSPIGALNNLKAKFRFVELLYGDKINISNFIIIPIEVPHGLPSFGFKIIRGKKKIVYTGDCEFLHDEQKKKFIEQVKNCDLIIHDSAYTNNQYKNYKGWGHSTFEDAVLNSINAGVKQIIFCHYDAEITDKKLEKEVQRLQKKYGDRINIIPSIEGETILV